MAMEEAMSRIRKAMMNVYGPFDETTIDKFRSHEREYHGNIDVINGIMKGDPNHEYNTALRVNAERIKHEKVRLQKLNEEKAQFEKEKRMYLAWLEKKMQHQRVSSMPFADIRPPVAPAVIEFFEKLEREEKEAQLKANLSATMQNESKPKIQPPKSAASTIPPKVKDEVMTPQPPVSFKSLPTSLPMEERPALTATSAKSVDLFDDDDDEPALSLASAKSVCHESVDLNVKAEFLTPLKLQSPSPAMASSIPKRTPPTAAAMTKSADFEDQKALSPNSAHQNVKDVDPAVSVNAGGCAPSNPIEPVRSAENVGQKASVESPLLAKSYPSEQRVPILRIRLGSTMEVRQSTPPLSPTTAKRLKKAAKKEKKRRRREEDGDRESDSDDRGRHHHKKSKKRRHNED